MLGQRAAIIRSAGIHKRLTASGLVRGMKRLRRLHRCSQSVELDGPAPGVRARQRKSTDPAGSGSTDQADEALLLGEDARQFRPGRYIGGDQIAGPSRAADLAARRYCSC
jgi:hypothetical protein